MANISSVITYNANLSPAQAQIKALTGQIAGLTAAFNTLDKSALSAQKSLATAFSANIGQIGGFTTQTIQATNAVQTFGKQLAANRLTMREAFREAIAGYTKQNSLMKQLAQQQVRYQQSIAVPTGGGQMMMLTPTSLAATGTSAAMAAQKFAIFNKLIDSGATSMLNWGKNTQWAGRQLMVGFSVPLAMFTALASKQFRDLDKELTRFQKVYGSDLGGAISESTTRMREQVQQLAYEISRTYGIAAKDTAALAADIAATGAEGEDLMNSVQQTTRLAVLGEVDRQEAMKATLALQSAFRMNTDELAESINFLNAVENQTSATLEDLATAIPKVGPVVRSLGGDVKDLATLLVAMREGGIPAAEAANALKSGLASLINPTKQASEVAQKFGIDLVGIVDANKGQLMPTIYAMKNALDGLDEFGRSRVIEQIFGKYQFARISALFDNIGRTGSQTQSVIELAAKSSTELAAVANQEIKTLTESTAVKFQRTLEELKNAIMPIGQALTETLIPILSFIGEGISKFSGFFQDLPGPIKNFAKLAIAIAALAGPVIMLVGLFGNLIANGLKFGMMVTRLGARMTGIKVEKFELLNSEVMAAKFGVDNLTTSFTNQETAMKRLVSVMSAYETSLRKLTTANPTLFIPGAIPGQRGAVPVRRANGSDRPEFVPGSGRGDKIPAMLEPGEFIVNRQATEQFAPVLLAMNRGTVKGFAKGMTNKPVSITGGQTRRLAPYTMFAPDPQGSGGFGMSREFFMAAEEFELSLRASAITAKGIEDGLRLSGETVGRLSTELEPVTKDITEALRLTATEMTDAGQEATHISQVIERATPRIDAILSSLPESTQTAVRKILSPTMEQVESGGYLRAPSADIDPETGKPVRTTMRSDRRGQAGSFYRRVKGVASKIGLSRTGMVQAHLPPEDYSLLGPRIPLSGAGMSLSPELRKEAEQYIERKSQEILDGFEQGVIQSIESQSPSRRMDREMAPRGKDFGDGATQGFIKGYKSSAAGKPIIAGPVGGTGIESISSAQKIAQAEKSILTLTEKQLPFTARRVRAEVELAASKERIAQISRDDSISLLEAARQTVAENERMDVIQRELEDAKRKELQIQKVIDEQKQRIANADAAQARSEEEEAKNAARRATVSMVGPGGLYGPGGYAAFANVGRRPNPEDVASAPGQSLTDAMDELDLEKDKKKGRMGGLASSGTNALFGLSMLTSTITMFSGASSDAANNLMMFSTALMTATMTAQMFSGTGVGGGIVSGVKKMGTGMQGLGTRLAPAGRHAAPGLLSRGLTGMGGALAGASGGAIAGGVAAVAIPLIITAAGLYMYKKSLDQAKEMANAAFAEPAKTAEFFGKTVDNVTETLKDINAAGASKELSEINDQLRMAVSEDYAGLIDKLKTSTLSVGAADLGAAYTKMIISGMSAQEAQDAIKAIAAEAGYAGGQAYSKAFSDGLLNAKDPEEAYKQIVGAASPETIARQAKETRGRVIGRAGGRAGTVETINPITGGPEFVQSLKASIEISQTAPELVAESLDQIRENYLALNQDANDLFGMGTSAREMAFDEFKNMMGELDDPVINQLLDQLQNSTAETQALAMQMTALGIPLTEAKNAAGRFDETLAKAAVENASRLAVLNAALNDTKEALTDFAESSPITIAMDKISDSVDKMQDKIESYAKSREKEKESIEENFEAEQKAREDSLEAMQDEMDTKREGFDEEMDQLDEKSDKIQKSSDAYIKSLQKNQKADSFYAQQRKTAFGALQKLASGDVFGFIQDRQQMSADAQQYSYDQMISGIEERRDLELDAIDETRDRKQKEQEEYENMMQDRMDAVQDLMDKESEMHEENMKNYDDETEKHNAELQRRLEKRSNRNREAKELIDGIKEGEVESYKEVTKVFGEQLAERYAELVKNQIASLDAVLKQQVATGEVEIVDAEQQLLQMYNDLFGAAYFGGTPTGNTGYGGVGSYEDLRGKLGLSSFRTPPSKTADGGPISGPGGPKSDVIPALLSNGEYVIQASSVGKYGKDMMDSINAGKFAEGGEISAPEKGLRGVLSFVQPKNKPSKPVQGPSTTEPGTTTSSTGITGPTGPANPSIGATNLTNSLRKWIPSDKLSFYPGWQSFGGGTLPVGILMHHTSGVGPGVLEWMARGGRVQYGSAPGPVVQAMISRSGMAHILAGGASLGWGAGEGSTQSFGGELPDLAEDIAEMGGAANSLWQIEVESAGLSRDFTPAQFDSIARMSAAIKEISGWSGFDGKIINHKDWAPGRKPDTLYDRQVFVDNANKVWNSGRAYKNGGFIKAFANGGMISGPGGPTSDLVPIMASNGEYVVKSAAVNKYGKGFMDQLNAGNVDFSGAQQYANGGLIGATPTFGMPEMASISPSDISANINNNIGGSSNSSTRNSSKVNIVINGAGGKSANAIANKVISMINQANNSRNHSRSAG